MKKTIQLILVVAVVLFATSACKSKQKITEIPAGAKKTATAPKPVTPAPVVAAPVKVSEPEVVRNENFSLVDGEKDALKFKYHVVVGSFTKQVNAQGLQKTLNSEGNKALIVINEKGMYRVLIASFNDYNQAHVKIKEIANRFADAWVLVQK
jgi:cell division protein FtsN